MARDVGQKVKLLKLYEKLREDTGADHPMKTHEIVEWLEANGIASERRTLAKDIAELQHFGYDVRQTKVGKEYAYYVENNHFKLAELRAVIDAVQAASFIPREESEELIQKLENLSGNQKAELLKKSITWFNTKKHTNHKIFANMETIETAIRNKRKLTFHYFDLNEKAKPVFRNDGNLYKAEPMALVYNEDNYYLICYNPEHIDKQTTYRVDRMADVEMTGEKVCKDAILLKTSIPRYMDSVIKMYAGKCEKVTLEFDPSVLNAFFDRFGENTVVRKIENGWYQSTVDVQKSPTFDGWLFQFREKIQIK